MDSLKLRNKAIRQISVVGKHTGLYTFLWNYKNSDYKLKIKF